MRTVERRIAKVEKAFLGWEDHGILTVWLEVGYGGSGQGVGMRTLDEPFEEGGKHKGRRGTAYGMQFVERVMIACGVREWSKVEGRTIYVLTDGEGWDAKVVGIAPLPTEPGKEFVFDDLLAEHKPELAGAAANDS